MTDFQVGSPLREPLLKFLIRYPTQTVDFFLLQLSGSQMNRLLMVSTRQSEDLFIIVYVSYAKQEECLRNILCENWYIIDRFHLRSGSHIGVCKQLDCVHVGVPRCFAPEICVPASRVSKNAL